MLTVANAAQLVKLWSYKTGSVVAASAAVVNGTVYVGSWDGYEYALDAATGVLKWKTFLGCSPSPCTPTSGGFGVTSSATVQNGMVYVGGGDSNWYALDAATGAISWTVPVGDNSPSGGHYNWSSPLIYNGYAYIGVASLSDTPLVQGQVLQVDLSTQQIVHTFDVVPTGQIGGGIWTSPSVDPATNTIYVTTGNQAYGQPPSSEPFAISILALDASTLTLKDFWQVPSSEQVVDSDWTTSPLIFDDVTGHTLIAAVNKGGYLYAFDRTNLSSGPVWQRRIAVGGPNPEIGDASASSGAFGGGQLYQAGGNATINSVPYSGSVRAFDPGSGNILWEQGTASAVIAALAYANGLIIDGAGATLEVRNAATGALLYSFTTRGTIYGAPSIANGRIFVGSTDGSLYAFGLPISGGLVLSAASRVPFQTITMSSTNFGAGEAVKVYWDSTSTVPLITPTSPASGPFVATLNIPQASTGTHTFIAVGQTSGISATVSLQVTPAVVMVPTSGAAGLMVHLIGVGFGAREMVVGLWYPGLSVLTNASSNQVGTVVMSVTVPQKPPGLYYVVGYGLSTKQPASAPFTVTGALAPRARSSALTLSVKAGRPTWPHMAPEVRAALITASAATPVQHFTGVRLRWRATATSRVGRRYVWRTVTTLSGTTLPGALVAPMSLTHSH